MGLILQPTRQQMLRIRRGLVGGGGGGGLAGLAGNIKAHFRPAELEASYADGATITAWGDASGTGRNLGQLSGSALAKASFLDGRMVMQVNGGILYHDPGANVDAELTDGATLAVVWHPLAHGNSPQIFSWNSVTSSSDWSVVRYGIHDRATGSNIIIVSGGNSANGATYSFAGVATAAWHYLIVRSPTNGIGKDAYFDGAWGVDNLPPADGSSITTMRYLQLGGIIGSGFGTLNGYIAEAIYLNKYCTTQEVEDIGAHFESEYPTLAA